jgi:nicotinate-nucleotide adenylyltransferase
MKLAIMGGAFDPPHLGHKNVLESLIALNQFERIHIIPSKQAPHKTHETAAEHRVALCKLVFERFRGVYIDEREVDRTGTSYTYLSLRELRQEFPELKKISLVVGYDWLDSIQTWKNWEEIREHIHLLLVKRPLDGLGEKTYSESEAKASLKSLKIEYTLVDNSFVEVSSSQIREAFKRGEEAYNLLPPEIHEYVRSHKLYQT